jgi:hypothetical protein
MPVASGRARIDRSMLYDSISDRFALRRRSGRLVA